jgi:hypothetical protein
VAHRRLRNAVRGRGLALLPVAAFAVHQLRYTLAYGSRSSQVLAAQGHSYLTSLAPWLVLLVALAAGSFLLRVARGGGDRPRRSLLELWALAAASLAAIYVAQELLEGLYAVGHPAGFAGVFGHGGLWALPLALLFGAAIAALLYAGDLIAAAASRRRRTAFGPPPLVAELRAVSLPIGPPLARAAAGRAPPLA